LLLEAELRAWGGLSPYKGEVEQFFMSAKVAGLNETPSETSDCKTGQTFGWCANALCLLTAGTQTPEFDFSSLLKSFCAE
jgi:hypothetical protein